MDQLEKLMVVTRDAPRWDTYTMDPIIHVYRSRRRVRAQARATRSDKGKKRKIGSQDEMSDSPDSDRAIAAVDSSSDA